MDKEVPMDIESGVIDNIIINMDIDIKPNVISSNNTEIPMDIDIDNNLISSIISNLTYLLSFLRM